MAFDIGSLSNLFAGLNIGNPAILLVNIIISTIVGGIVFLLVVKLIARHFHEDVKSSHAFAIVFVITLINLLGVLSLIPFISLIPAFAIQIIVWIALVKLLFSDLAIAHSVLTGIVGWILSGLVTPAVVGIVIGLI